MSELSSDFIIELAKTCVVSKDILEAVRPHLSYSYLQSEPQKQIFKYIFDYHGANNKPPTIGLIAQNVHSRDALSLIDQIRNVNIHNSKDSILEAFQDFIKRARFVETQGKIVEVFNKGETDKAYDIAAKEYGEILQFSLKRSMHSKIYADFEKRREERQNRDYTTRKIPAGIPALDYHTRGGIDIGTGLLALARSGVGKTSFLRSLGFHASFRGINVLHIASGDSTVQEIEDGYDAMWTGVDTHHIREGSLSGADINKVEKARQAYLAQAGEIYVHVFKQFNSATILDCRSVLVDLLKEADIKLVLFDLLDTFDPGDGKRYNTGQDGLTNKKKATADKIVNIATEFDVAVAAVTQASDVKREDWNDPNFILTRNNVSNAKSVFEPFAYGITLNQTDDEKDAQEMRIHEEKLRHYNILSWQSTYSIKQKREVGRFIDVAETNKLFWNSETKSIIRPVIKRKEKIKV